jgi:hypothetical protein
MKKTKLDEAYDKYPFKQSGATDGLFNQYMDNISLTDRKAFLQKSKQEEAITVHKLARM